MGINSRLTYGHIMTPSRIMTSILPKIMLQAIVACVNSAQTQVIGFAQLHFPAPICAMSSRDMGSIVIPRVYMNITLTLRLKDIIADIRTVHRLNQDPAGVDI